MKVLIDGFIHCLQFFTSVPINKNISMEKQRLKTSLLILPIVGLLIGILASTLMYFLQEWSPFSSLAIAFIVFIYFIFITGGLHLDGWADCSDAFFSFRDKDRRLEIMKDPQVGTFAVLSLLIMLAARFLFIYETILVESPYYYFFSAIIPFLSRSMMLLLLIKGPGLAKQEGLAALFSQSIRSKHVWVIALYNLVLVGGSYIWLGWPIVQPLIYGMLAILLFYVWASFFIKREFNGLTGDTLGASIEGGETYLWMILWLLHSYAMA
ncbi:adenosylcobinamide-GDP ribazoletransferase [Peribacillus alkalitolerans]|uniref:adenosylcobinamide-GDP ribazoletransferase n=1 Tax=Peribacillus alkalitolerans TaxID=1550385 RepID=UPI0013D5E66F|nr:adenosylcobinamide-GDP ribazoletransferase [Peribacillus alkalitolerans]